MHPIRFLRRWALPTLLLASLAACNVYLVAIDAFVAAPDAAVDPAGFETRFDVPLTRIGTVTDGRSLEVFAGERPIPYQPQGWDPFR